MRPSSQIRFLVGIDEVGRGPLAGPVSVGGVVFPVKTRHFLLTGVKDSKALSPNSRSEWFRKIKEAKQAGILDYSVSCVSSKIIDERGIVHAVRVAIRRTLNKLNVPPHQTLVLLDGSLSAPEHFLYQETIIRGDQTVPIIGLASIAAKVTRDRKMVRIAKKYPDFGFEIHKGYGTLFHRKKIKKFGPCEIHRRSFLKGILS